MYSAAEEGQFGTQYGDDGFGTAFSTKSVRLAFIRKVYGILSVQLLITFGFVCVFAIPEGVREWSHTNGSWLIWVAMLVGFGTMMVLVCCGELRRQTPHNYIALGIFTFAESFMLGILSSLYPKEIVLMALGITLLVCAALTAFAFQTKVDFTVFNGLLFVGLIILMIFGVVLMFWRSPVAQLVYACLGALIFSAYLVIDTQMIVGGTHTIQISSEEYIFASLTLYMDIINLFIYILQIVAAASKN